MHRPKATSLLLLLSVLCFLAGTRVSASTDSKDAVAAGAILFRDTGCAHCHGGNLEGTKKGPALADIGTDTVWTPDKIHEQILNGGEKMPPFADSLSDPEIDQIVQYLRAKDRPVPPPAAGSSTSK